MRAAAAFLFVIIFFLAFAFGFCQGERMVILNQQPYFNEQGDLLIEYNKQVNIYQID